MPCVRQPNQPLQGLSPLPALVSARLGFDLAGRGRRKMAIPESVALPESLLRLHQIIGQCAVSEKEAAENRRKGRFPKRPRREIRPLLPVARSTWLAWVKAGRAPRPIKVCGATLWRSSDLVRFIEQAGR
jgi:predicted DNA-binding transcriptional regulator AlpA